MNKKAANIVLKIIKKFFNKQKYNIEIPQNILSSLMHHIKITSMGGISYLVLKNNSNIPKNFLTDLKNQHSIIKKQDRLLQGRPGAFSGRRFSPGRLDSPART